MNEHYVVALCQGHGLLTDDNWKEKLAELLHQAAEEGARLVVCSGLPEEVSTLGMAQLAREMGLWLLWGPVRVVDGKTKLYLTSDRGEEATQYEKLHFTDLGGSKLTTAETPVGKLGCSIGGDVRIPELYRLMALDGAQVFVLLSDEDGTTTTRQWELLLRARAMENGCWMLAISREDSMVVDPNGIVNSRSGGRKGLIFGEINEQETALVRQEIPLLHHLRPDVYSVIQK